MDIFCEVTNMCMRTSDWGTMPLSEFFSSFSPFDTGIALGFCPNRLVFNEYLNLGILNEGMGNNAEWHPFSITDIGYIELVQEISILNGGIEMTENLNTIKQWNKFIVNEFKKANPDLYIKSIKFYLATDEYGDFSNSSNYGIEMNNRWWKTVEHYYQASKFDNVNYMEKIANIDTPRMASMLGKSRKYNLKADWKDIKDTLMYEAVLKKFTTHKNLTKMLLDTNNRSLIESSPSDYYWGCGLDGTGQNRLGEILEQVREDIKHL